LKQQHGLKMVLAYVTNVTVKMNMFRTRCMLFYFAKTIEFVHDFLSHQNDVHDFLSQQNNFFFLYEQLD